MKLPWSRPHATPEIEYAEVLLHDEKAYVPVMGKSNLIGFRETETVLSCALTPEALAETLQQVIKEGNPPVRHPSEAEIRQRTPVQRAIGVRSWRQLARAGAMSAGISWVREEGKVKIAFTPRHTEHKMEADYKDRKEFSIGTPPRTLAECILAEWQERQTAKARTEES